MDKYKRYTSLIIFVIAVALMMYVAICFVIMPQYNEWDNLNKTVEEVTNNLDEKRKVYATVKQRLRRLQESILSSQKKVYSPVEDKLGNDTLFFTLYSDVIEMVRANTIKIKSIDYKYNPENDIFAKQEGSIYFVCDVNMEVVSNYVNLGKLIQDLYQYPYYIKINSIEVVPYQYDKKILLSTISLRLYSHTAPERNIEEDIRESGLDSETLKGATEPLPE